MKKVVLDTNIYISAILFGGKPKQIIDLARNNKLHIIISPYIIWEIKKILGSKFNIPHSKIIKIENNILLISNLIDVHKKHDIIIKSDVSDNNILYCAIEGKAELIITGDKDLLNLKKFNDISIIKPNDFLGMA